MLDHARRLLDLDAKWLQPFDVEDPFHDGLRLEGFLSLRPDHRYGALALLRVGGADAPQRILATPKLHYPFDRTGAFTFPPLRRIACYEKLDGTNVLAYRYRDADGAVRTTYKLRLSPVLRNGRWGDFLDLWRELLTRHPEIAELPVRNDCAVSFEMYGARNPHLIAYDEPLAVAALFGVRADATTVPPAALDVGGVPVPRLLAHVAHTDDPVERFRALRAAMELQNRDLGDGLLAGTEGAVLHFEDTAGRVHLFKCKPESVESIHWKAGISRAGVLATCWNLLESSEELSYDALLPLLREEYDDDQIESFRPHIDACLAQVAADLAYRERVRSLYVALGLDLHADKRACMRALSSHFPRAEMKRVHAALVTLFAR